jgi:formyl-CoA transferase
MHGLVPRLSATPGILARPAPKLGEHNEEILLPLLGQKKYDKLTTKGGAAS